MRPTSWGRRWNWEEQSKRQRARALSRLDSELTFLAEPSTEKYLADAEAFADVQAAAAGGGSGLSNGATLAAGAAGSTRTLDRHPSLRFPTPLPHFSHPRPIPHSQSPSPIPFSSSLARRWSRPPGAGCAGAWRGPTRGSVQADSGPCTPAGPAGRAYKSTGLLTELKPEQQTKAARSSRRFSAA